jgi:hypothetical protein
MYKSANSPSKRKKRRAGSSVMRIGGKLHPIKIRKYNFPVEVRKIEDVQELR